MKKSQKGIVLVSCIVFLIILLLLLKVALSTSRISEQKTGIEQDISIAKESALLALRSAESKIVSFVQKEKLSACKDGKEKTPECENLWSEATVMAWYKAWQSTTLTIQEKEIIKQFTQLADEDKQYINNVAEIIKDTSGIYAGNKVDTCSDVAKCLENNSILSITVDIAGLDEKYDLSPRYIIERFLPSELEMTDPGANMVFRITAISFGQSGGRKNTDEGITTTIYQANYRL